MFNLINLCLKDIIVRQNATLKDLKNAIKRFFILKNQRNNNSNNNINNEPRVILNWKYIWKRYCLCFEGEKLLDDKKSLKDYKIYNKCELTFLKQQFQNRNKSK